MELQDWIDSLFRALNYKANGTIIDHELTHGFDNSGRLYDEDGNLRQWWTNITINQYSDEIECFVKHYNSYYVDEVQFQLDRFTLSPYSSMILTGRWIHRLKIDIWREHHWRRWPSRSRLHSQKVEIKARSRADAPRFLTFDARAALISRLRSRKKLRNSSFSTVKAFSWNGSIWMYSFFAAMVRRKYRSFSNKSASCGKVIYRKLNFFDFWEHLRILIFVWNKRILFT